MRAPRKPQGITPHAQFLRDTCSAIDANRILPGVGYRVKESPSGTTLEIPQRSPPAPFHPFKIYQFPEGLRKFHNDDDWRRVKVHAGILSLPGGNSYSMVPGTDWASPLDEDAYADPYGLYNFGQVPPTTSAAIVPGGFGDLDGGWNEILVPEGTAYAIWISFIAQDNAGTTLQPSICYGETDSSAVNLANGNSFTDHWPTLGPQGNDPYHIYIGTVHAPSDPTLYNNKRFYIKQHLKTDVILEYGPVTTSSLVSGRGLRERFRGEYDNSLEYFIGDTVIRTVTTSGNTWVKRYIYLPSSSSNYRVGGSTVGFDTMSGVDPDTNTPDPWILQGSYPASADYVSAAYNAAKYYLRTA